MHAGTGVHTHAYGFRFSKMGGAVVPKGDDIVAPGKCTQSHVLNEMTPAACLSFISSSWERNTLIGNISSFTGTGT